MDNIEYTIKKDEIKALIAQKEYAQAAEIADTIDWRRVRSVMMLCTISDLYKINRRYEDAKNMLLLAYDIRPGGRAICYSLCELCIKMGEYVQAVNYYKEYIQVAPKDSDRYILLYKLYEAQDVSLEERIEVLKELKKREYREKWAYELAYLYHRIGQATLCVEECDELILWFGDGKYVYKAMELKMLHQPLTPSQQEKYEHRFDDKGQSQPQTLEGQEEQTPVHKQSVPENAGDGQDIARTYADSSAESAAAAEKPEKKQEEMDIQVKTVDVGRYNTINLQAELAAGLQEVLEKENRADGDAITRAIIAPMLVSDTERPDISEEESDAEELDPEAEEMEETEVFFGETGEIGSIQPEIVPELAGNTDVSQRVCPEEVTELPAGGEPEKEPVRKAADETAELVMRQLRMENRAEEQVLTAQPPKELAGVLSQESDGQISLVVPEREAVEKQITGQMSIEDILTEWERMKQENEEKRKEEVRQHVLQQTGNMFTEFEAAVRDNLLEQLEGGNATAEDQMNEAELVADAEEQLLSAKQEAAGEESGYDEVEEIEEIIEPEELEEETEEFGETGEPETEEEIEEFGETEEPETEEETEEFGETGEPEAEEETGETGETGEPEAEEETGETGETGEPEAAEETGESGETGEPEAEEETGETGEPEAEEEVPAEQNRQKARMLTREEKELYAPFVQSRSAREQLVRAIDNISMAAYTGNIIVTGEEGMDTITLAKNMIREIQMTDSNFSGKVAKISGQGLNGKNVDEILDQLKNGALIVQKASGINSGTAAALYKTLQQENLGIIIVLEDTKKGIAGLFAKAPQLRESFTARMDMEALSNDMLVSFGRQYAREMEYFIDDLGVLALHTRIEELQTIDHVVTVVEVKRIVDEAIRHANRKTLRHFFDVLFARRYDDEDMIILTEKDFV